MQAPKEQTPFQKSFRKLHACVDYEVHTTFLSKLDLIATMIQGPEGDIDLESKEGSAAAPVEVPTLTNANEATLDEVTTCLNAFCQKTSAIFSQVQWGSSALMRDYAHNEEDTAIKNVREKAIAKLGALEGALDLFRIKLLAATEEKAKENETAGTKSNFNKCATTITSLISTRHLVLDSLRLMNQALRVGEPKLQTFYAERPTSISDLSYVIETISSTARQRDTSESHDTSPEHLRIVTRLCQLDSTHLSTEDRAKIRTTIAKTQKWLCRRYIPEPSQDNSEDITEEKLTAAFNEAKKASSDDLLAFLHFRCLSEQITPEAKRGLVRATSQIIYERTGIIEPTTFFSRILSSAFAQQTANLLTTFKSTMLSSWLPDFITPPALRRAQPTDQDPERKSDADTESAAAEEPNPLLDFTNQFNETLATATDVSAHLATLDAILQVGRLSHKRGAELTPSFLTNYLELERGLSALTLSGADDDQSPEYSYDRKRISKEHHGALSLIQAIQHHINTFSIKDIEDESPSPSPEDGSAPAHTASHPATLQLLQPTPNSDGSSLETIKALAVEFGLADEYRIMATNSGSTRLTGSLQDLEDTAAADDAPQLRRDILKAYLTNRPVFQNRINQVIGTVLQSAIPDGSYDIQANPTPTPDEQQQNDEQPEAPTRSCSIFKSPAAIATTALAGGVLLGGGLTAAGYAAGMTIMGATLAAASVLTATGIGAAVGLALAAIALIIAAVVVQSRSSSNNQPKTNEGDTETSPQASTYS